ncbi:hypothetical protein FRC04_000191 [Tulasnella sp. 424]|nr:hypothetical protein FRC04_000191 [Tulasnella sp. 424]KAG8982055.1 hypothetical protein FRC05_000197 [Tulasnella sp. 425]
MADVQRNLTQKEEELAQKKEELAQKERTIRELNDQLRKVHLDRAVYSRLLDAERARHDGESHAALIGAMTEKLAQLESKLKSFFTPVERVDAAVSADAVAPSPNPYTSWKSRGVQVNLSTPGTSIPSQEQSHDHAVAAGPSIMHAQQSTSSSVSVSNSQTASGSTQPQGNAHGNSPQQLDVSEPSSSDSGPQSEPSSSNSTPSPAVLKNQTQARLRSDLKLLNFYLDFSSILAHPLSRGPLLKERDRDTRAEVEETGTPPPITEDERDA